MTTIALTETPSVEQRERVFFLAMAMSIVMTVGLGFSLFLLVGISSFSAPWWVHVHAVTFVSWIVFYLMQNVLVFSGKTALHRQLGIWGVGLAGWMVIVGVVLTPVTLSVMRSPPFFTPEFFLALDWANIMVFAALVLAGFRMRKRTDWHRRLMLCATICVIAPAWGRLLVLANAMSLWNNLAALLLYVVMAMLADWRIRGSVHPAYFVGAGAIFGMGILVEVLAALPQVIELAARLTATA